MPTVLPSGNSLGCTIEGLDVSRPLSQADESLILDALGQYGVLCFPNQSLEPEAHKAFSARFGSLEVNVASGRYVVPGHPEVMILSNMVEDGKQVGLGDAGQDWHTDMSYSATIAFLNVLYAVKVPTRDGRPLGDTEFLDMCAAYDALPEEWKARVAGKTATHDFDKFWAKMVAMPGTQRKPLTPEQRAAKPPVSHPIVLRHPISGRNALYCNVGYAVRVDGVSQTESDEILEYLFAHQVNDRFKYAHHWTERDLLVWDNLWTMHNAVADYGPDEIRLMRRCQVMADKVLA
ncbi:MAG: TauD/TfdA family dioxygenase [Alphaproteobacteria bacterium]|nr:TauD/TfdA family dioxygenase [Alphaproteobacteria bacterium]